MLEKILKKLGVNTIQEFIDSERKIAEKYKGYEIERANPFSKLTSEESMWLKNYVIENGIEL